MLYRDRLHRPDEAARCLEQGGLWTEAIAQYEELAEFEKAGDLYRQLDQPDHARQAYRSAVAKYLAQNDCLTAARLLENKLDAPDEAITQLEAGWPSSNQAGGMFRGVVPAVGAAWAGMRRPPPRSSNSATNPFSRGNGGCSSMFSRKRQLPIRMPWLRPWPPTRRARSPALDCAMRTMPRSDSCWQPCNDSCPPTACSAATASDSCVRGFGRRRPPRDVQWKSVERCRLRRRRSD